MDANVSLISRLMAKYARHEALTDEEQRALEDWWNASADNKALAEQFADEEWVRDALARLKNVPKKEMWNEISRQMDEIDAAAGIDPKILKTSAGGKVRRLSLRLSLAAAGVLIILAGVWLIRGKGTKDGHGIGEEKSRVAVPLAAEKKRAVWKDDKGRVVRLDSLRVGEVVAETINGTLRKVDSNALAYDVPAGEPENHSSVYWTSLETGPESPPYHVQLSDGSGVWLAGGSSFRYANNSRDTAHRYNAAGKVFFDIAKAGGRPFVIDLSSGVRVDVMGTKFVVETPEGSEGKLVTLLTGELQIETRADTVRLRPGEKATAGVAGVNIEKIGDDSTATNWIGQSYYSHFQKTDMKTAIAKVAKWYGLKVVNPGNVNGTTVTLDIAWPGSPDSMLQSIGTIQTGFARLALIRNEIVVSAWDESK